MHWLLLVPIVVLIIALRRRMVKRRMGEAACVDAAQPPVYRARGLWKTYPGPSGPVSAIRNFDVELWGGMTAIIGPSGGGKTTLLNLLGGLDRPSAGWIEFRGQAIPFRDPEAMRRFRAEVVAWVFQELNLIGHQTAIENVALPLLCRGVSRKEALETADELLERLHIAHLRARYPEQLSRGQRQRVAIARAFASDAGVILADEPTGSLDPETADEVMRAFRDLSLREGKPVVLVTHNLQLAGYCDRRLLCTRDGLVEVPPASDDALLGELNGHWESFGAILDEDDDPSANIIALREFLGGNGNAADDVDDGIYRIRDQAAAR